MLDMCRPNINDDKCRDATEPRCPVHVSIITFTIYKTKGQFEILRDGEPAIKAKACDSVDPL